MFRYIISAAALVLGLSILAWFLGMADWIFPRIARHLRAIGPVFAIISMFVLFICLFFDTVSKML